MGKPRHSRLTARWQDANKPFEHNGGDGTPGPETTVAVKTASSLCIVSVHAVNHYNKDEGLKPADLYTGGLAIALAEKFNSNLVYNTHRDPAISPWRQQTAADRHIAAIADKKANDNGPLIVLDLHGVRNNPHFDVAIGTSIQPPNPQQQKMIELFSALARRNGLTVAVNPEGYRADGGRTITTRALTKTPYCLQFEFSRACRQPDGKTTESAAMLRTMCGFLRQLQQGTDIKP